MSELMQQETEYHEDEAHGEQADVRHRLGARLHLEEVEDVPAAVQYRERQAQHEHGDQDVPKLDPAELRSPVSRVHTVEAVIIVVHGRCHMFMGYKCGGWLNGMVRIVLKDTI